MKTRNVVLIHILFWIVASIIPHIVLLAYSPDMPSELKLYQSLTQLYYIIVFYFIYFFVSPATIGSSRKLTTGLIIFGTSVVFLFFLKLGKVVMIDSKYSLNLTKYGIYSTGHYASDILYIIFYSAFAILIKMFVKWYDDRKAAEEKMIQDHKLELELLKAQLNPHFFFNTLNNIYSLVYKKSDEAPAALMKMSDIMRPQADIGLNLIYENTVWTGLTYRTGAGGALISSIRFKFVPSQVMMTTMFFGYSFDFTLNNMSKATYGTHEVVIALKFGETGKRFRWIDRY